MKTLILILIAFNCYAQSYFIGSSGNLKPLTTKDVQLSNGLTGVINYPGDSSVYNFVSPAGKKFTLRYIVTEVGLPPVEPPIPPVPPVIIDNMAATYLPVTAWVVPAGYKGITPAVGWHAKTLSYTAVANATVTYKHPTAYSKIEIFGEFSPNHGIVAVSIDGGQETLVDLYSLVKELPALLHTFTVTKGIHEVKIRITGTKNIKSTLAHGLVDYFKIYE